jgi:glycosyltransferase involved in cell wall biosynthesis
MPISLKMADRIISVSRSTARDLTGNFRGLEHKISVIPEAASMMECRRIDSTVDQPYLLFVGTLEPRKNLNRLLQAFRKVIDSGIGEYSLIIAGGQGWSRDSLERIIEDLSLEQFVKVLGYVEDKFLHALYRNAYAVVLPSLYEGFGLPLLESMQYGTPVISTNVSAMPEIVGDAGILVDPLSVDEISAAIIRLLSDQALREKLSKRSIRQASKYSWKDSAMKTHDLFRALNKEQ